MRDWVDRTGVKKKEAGFVSCRTEGYFPKVKLLGACYRVLSR